MNRLNDVVRSIPYFAQLPAPELEKLAGSARFVALDGGETLFREGEPADGLYYLCQGRVKIVRYSPEGRQLIIRESYGRDIQRIGALDGCENAATAVAEEHETHVLIISGDVIRELAGRYPGLSQQMMKEMAEKLRFAMGKMNRLALMDVKSRLAAYLLEAAGDSGTLSGISHEELAAHLGTVRQVLSRALGDLQRSGAVEVRRGSIRILDSSLLDEMT